MGGAPTAFRWCGLLIGPVDFRCLAGAFGVLNSTFVNSNREALPAFLASSRPGFLLVNGRC